MGPWSEGIIARPHPLKAIDAHRAVFDAIEHQMKNVKYNCREFFENNFFRVSASISFLNLFS